jgi:two-component system, OmpR family, sensor histidine kinase KdpD
MHISAIVNVTTVGFAYLVAILLVAAWWGMAASLVASIVATVCFNYFFLPPIGTWAIEDSENWVALFALLATSLIASDLSNRARRRTVEANARKAEMERLYALSRAVLTMNDGEPVVPRIARELVRICAIPSVAIYDCVTDVVHVEGVQHGVDLRLKEIASTGGAAKDESTGMLFAAISLGAGTTGSIAIRGSELSNTALHALLNLIAITLDNARSRDIMARTQAARQSEEFKSTLLDGLAHEFKTPLTSIKAATTALLGSNICDAAQQRELLTIVDQEAERLSRLVTEATRVARLEAGQLHMNPAPHSVDDLLRGALEQMEPKRDGRSIETSFAPDLPRIYVDAELIQLAMKQLIDNALKYSPRKSPIRISSRQSGDNVLIRLSNECEPLSHTERARIFDKFYRGQNVRQKVAGTGMGLAVARDILVAHGGGVELSGSNERVAEFVVRIPTI